MSDYRNAKKTTYGGVVFRSRNEARWGALFDHLKFQWSYEPRMEFPGGRSRYLDFEIEFGNGSLLVEVKSNVDDLNKARKKLIGICRNNDCTILCIAGPPHWRTSAWHLYGNGDRKKVMLCKALATATGNPMLNVEEIMRGVGTMHFIDATANEITRLDAFETQYPDSYNTDILTKFDIHGDKNRGE